MKQDDKFYLKDIQVLDNDILVKVPKPRANGIILSTEQQKKLTVPNSFEVLQIGSMVNMGEGITPIEVGAILNLDVSDNGGTITLADYDYESNAMIVYRHMIKFIIKPKEVEK